MNLQDCDWTGPCHGPKTCNMFCLGSPQGPFRPFPILFFTFCLHCCRFCPSFARFHSSFLFSLPSFLPIDEAAYPVVCLHLPTDSSSKSTKSWTKSVGGCSTVTIGSRAPRRTHWEWAPFLGESWAWPGRVRLGLKDWPPELASRTGPRRAPASRADATRGCILSAFWGKTSPLSTAQRAGDVVTLLFLDIAESNIAILPTISRKGEPSTEENIGPIAATDWRWQAKENQCNLLDEPTTDFGGLIGRCCEAGEESRDSRRHFLGIVEIGLPRKRTRYFKNIV